MKRLFITLLIIMLSSPAAFAGDKITTYCWKRYKLPAKITAKSPEGKTRTGKKYVIVWKLKSKSKGFYGISKHGIISYGRKIRKNKTVTSYLIYSPYDNVPDNVVKVYHKIRKEGRK